MSGPRGRPDRTRAMAEDRARLLHSLEIDRVTEQRRPSRKRWLVPASLAVVGFAVAALALWGFAPNHAAVRQSDPVPGTEVASPPRVLTVTRPQTTEGLVASGYVVARRKATVAAEITGKVVEVLVEEGMLVEAGQVVARLDSMLAGTDLALAQSRAAASEAAVAAIAAELRDAERIFGRTQSLSLKNFATEADLTKAEARLGVLRAQLSQSQAQLQTTRLDARRQAEVLEQHQVRAPFSGVVVERSAQPGEMISPMSAGGSFTRTGICTIVDMSSIEIEVDVNEAYIGRVRPGGEVVAVLDAYPEWTIAAFVIAIVPTANREKATIKVRIGFKQKDARILPDMAVKVTFLEGKPASASAVLPAVH
jgi:HlyD family secretion protein